MCTVQGVQHIGVLRGQEAVERGGAGHAAQAALLGSAQAQQPDHVTRVGVKRQPAGCLVGARRGVGLPVAPLVAHVAQQVAARVLRYRLAQVQAQAVGDAGAVLAAVAVHRHTPHQRHARTLLDDAPDTGQLVGQAASWKMA
jgi:hypothetical protein